MVVLSMSNSVIPIDASHEVLQKQTHLSQKAKQNKNKQILIRLKIIK